VRKETFFWLGTSAITVMFAILVGFGASGAAVIFLGILGTVAFAGIGWMVRRPGDASWLPNLLVIGFIVKLAGTVARYYMVTTLYGAGDAFRYYRVGTDLAAEWRSGQVPGLRGVGSLGTQVVEAITGGMFAVFTPDMLGGFLVFAVIAYMGQVLLYVAFRRWAEPHQLKPYALLIFLLPTYAFWPSSIGKDAIVVLGLGAAAYFVARSLQAFQIRWLIALAFPLALLGFIRVHIAGLVVGSMVVATLIAKLPAGAEPGIRLRRLFVMVGAIFAAVVVLTVAPDILGVDITSTQDRDGFVADIVRRTSERGTVASGGAITKPWEIPGALAHVLFRPFAWEASEIQHYLAALETSFIAFLTVWKFPAIIRNLRRWRSNGYVVFSTVYVLAFAILFSTVRNVGIIARQRGQVLAFFLCFVIALGWESKKRKQAPAQLPVLSYSGETDI